MKYWDVVFFWESLIHYLKDLRNPFAKVFIYLFKGIICFIFFKKNNNACRPFLLNTMFTWSLNCKMIANLKTAYTAGIYLLKVNAEYVQS